MRTSKLRAPALAGVLLAIALAAAPRLHAQALTKEAIKAVVERPGPLAAMSACVEKSYHPTWFSFTFTIDTGGRTTLAKADPAVDGAIFSCLRAAFAAVVFPPQESALEVTYPINLPAAVPAPPPGAAAGCTKDTDCKGARICDGGVCREGGMPIPPGPAAATRRPYSSGAGLFVPGVISTGVGAAFLLASAIVSKQGAGADSSRLVFIVGMIGSVVGGALLPGATTLASSSARKLGGKGSTGFVAAGWALYGLYAAVSGTLLGLCIGVDYGEHTYRYSASVFGLLFLTTVVNAVGWGIARGRASRAASAPVARADAPLVVPLLAPVRGGASVGILVAY